MFRIGLTGGIGSGKTTISDYFNSLYAVPIIDADLLSHELMAPDGDAYQEVIDLFGDNVLIDGEINRQALRYQIFNNPIMRKALEDIIHPKVKLSILKNTESLSGDYCLVVIPLLFESNMQTVVDRILVVSSTQELQINRVIQRDDCHADHVKKIINSQTSPEQRLKMADDIIVNNGTKDSLIPQIDQLHKKYLALSQ